MRSTFRTRLLGAALGAAVLSACDSGGSQEPPPTPAITVAVGAPTVTVLPGGNATLAVNITRTGGYTGAVNLTAESLPAGVTVAAVTIPSGATTGTLNIAAAASATPATSTVTVRAAGTGVNAQTATFQLTVQEPPGFSVAMSPASVTIAQSSGGTATVNVTRTGGFSGPVSLAATGLPAGMTVEFVPASTSGTTSLMTITVGANTPVATHAITIQANAEGMTQRTATLNVQVVAAQAIGIALNPATLSVAQGASGTITVNLTRTGGFGGAVTLTAANLPLGVTVTAGQIAADATSATLTVNAGTGAETGSRDVTIRALGTGVADATATLALTVTPTVPGGYTLAVAPATVSVQQGGTTTSTVNLTRTGGFAGAVALTATGAPAGMTVSFNPASATANQSTVTVATTAAVAPGTYPITIRGAATGLAEQTATLNVQVTGGQTGGNVTVRFCPVSGLPIWVAVQNGTGAWTRVTGNANHEYTFQIDTRGGVATVMNNDGVFETSIAYGTRAEIEARGAAQCAAGTGATRTVNGTVTGLGLTDMAFVSLGGDFTMVNFLTGSNFQLDRVAPGSVDLLASRMALSQTGTTMINRFVLQRGLNPANNSTINVDFTGPNSFAPASATATIGGAGTDQVVIATNYITAGGSYGLLGLGDAVVGGSATYFGMPADRQVNGDFHLLGISATPAGTDEPTHGRSATHIFRTIGNRTLNLGPQMSAVSVTTVATQPYARIRLSFPVQPEYNSWFIGSLSQQTRHVDMQMSADYLAGASTVVLEVPDFSALQGWNNSWGLQPGIETNWIANVQRWTTGGVLPTQWTENTVSLAAYRTGDITP